MVQPLSVWEWPVWEWLVRELQLAREGAGGSPTVRGVCSARIDRGIFVCGASLKRRECVCARRRRRWI